MKVCIQYFCLLQWHIWCNVRDAPSCWRSYYTARFAYIGFM